MIPQTPISWNNWPALSPDSFQDERQVAGRAQEQGILGTRPRLGPRALNLNSEEANERNDPFCRALSRSPQKKAASRMNPFQSNKYSKGGSVARRFCL